VPAGRATRIDPVESLRLEKDNCVRMRYKRSSRIAKHFLNRVFQQPQTIALETRLDEFNRDLLTAMACDTP
jgi:hypothetical protein